MTDKPKDIYGNDLAVNEREKLLKAAVHIRDCVFRKEGWNDCPDCEKSEIIIARAEAV